MVTMIYGYYRISGLLSMREEAIQEGLRKVEEDREAVDGRSEAFRIRQEAQFLAMEQIVRSLKVTGGLLDGLVDRLPFTAPPRYTVLLVWFLVSFPCSSPWGAHVIAAL